MFKFFAIAGGSKKFEENKEIIDVFNSYSYGMDLEFAIIPSNSDKPCYVRVILFTNF